MGRIMVEVVYLEDWDGHAAGTVGKMPKRAAERARKNGKIRFLNERPKMEPFPDNRMLQPEASHGALSGSAVDPRIHRAAAPMPPSMPPATSGDLDERFRKEAGQGQAEK